MQLTNPKKEREYLCSLTDRYQDFLHSVDTFYRMFQQKMKANTEPVDFSSFVKTLNEIYHVKKRIAEYYWQPVSTNVYMTLQKIAFAWRSFLHAALCIIKSQNWGRSMQLQPYFERIISYERELLSMVKADCENRYSSESKMVN